MTISRSESHSHRSSSIYSGSVAGGSPQRRTISSSGLNTPLSPGSPTRTGSSEVGSPAIEANTSLRLERLRKEMKARDLGVYVVPSEDAHQSEYTSPVDQRRAFISGFSGSAGVAVITRDVTCMNDIPEGLGALSTDGRYFTQAASELDANWHLLKQGVEGEPTWQEWAIKEAIQMSLDSGKEVHIGFDPRMITYADIEGAEKLLKESISSHPNSVVKLVPVRDNLIDILWPEFEKRPQREFKSVLYLKPEYTGEGTNCKFARLREKHLTEYGSDTMVLNALDEIAWFLNMRGTDIEFNPLFYSYLMIQGDRMTLYTDNHERFDEYQDYLASIQCELKYYDDVWSDIKNVASELNKKHRNVILTRSGSWRMVNCIVDENFIIVQSPIQGMKEVKNRVELQGQKKAQIKDGLALIRYFSWLEKKLTQDNDFINEYDAGLKLLEFRSKLDNFKGLSFETISSTGSNGAIIHYAPKSEESSLINPNKLYLCDSGSQFLEGTTDTTRTLHFGQPSQEEIDNYTLVLKGQIALAELKFPEGLTGLQIDCIARQFLWANGLDYAHGTGHGVDSYGPVHSMGVGIGFRAYCNDNTVKAGHLISDEPGYYKPGYYGIRLENMVFCEYDDDPKTFNGKRFLKFRTVTKVPYCRRLINVKMLTEKEKEWINNFHRDIWDLYRNKLSRRSWEYQWLKRETNTI
ncbi:hypothetical protein FOA43_001515 [Brettanomyces nanus]|uniref:Xaa-Pro aminopeptidase n=1 Tax=Eeniella nana TaxID=13502 RepID=A0A875RXJ5_EENNA|nr:uncharacterized protein FOA43_001515 [Brettanomyces nanus]QPG74191.1 hypothetical protein FOA43_001515 [Brettanomyces nanus]